MQADTSGKFYIKDYLNATIIVAALGYFVDIYDLILFSIVRVPSLKSLGLSGSQLEDVGLVLINIQMIGMLVGGICWGILGDKRGRLSVLFGSILLYSIANIANGMVHTVNQYAVLRFIAGFGLAGELGAGITLVSELLSKEKRGWGTMIVATVGLSGAVFAGFMGTYFENYHEGWRICYYIGGALGIALLLLRIGILESGMYKDMKHNDVKRGNMMMLFNNSKRFKKYIKCILIGLPIWYTIGILITFSPKFAAAIGVVGEIKPSLAVMYFYSGVTVGDIMCGAISQWMKSRTKVILIYLIILIATLIPFFAANGMSATGFYYVIVLVGFGAGFWAVLMTIAAETFGTNLRSTVTTSVPNFIRGSLFLISILFKVLQSYFEHSFTANQALIYSAIATGVVCLSIPIIVVLNMEDTFGKNLEYIEE